MQEILGNSEIIVLPSGSGTSNEQQEATSEDIQNEADIFKQLTLLSKEINSLKASITPDSGLKLKEPPDLNEILQTNEALITPTSHNVGILNTSCQLVLKEMEYQLLKLLKQNRKEQETVLGFLNSKGRMQDLDNGKKNISFKCAGMPYFKDLDGFFPPDNDDVLNKKRNNELLPVDFIDVSPTWSLTDTKTLIKAVKKYTEESQSEDHNLIDWLKISASDMDGKFSAIECRSKWLLHLKPGINRSKWGLKETKSLEKIAEKYNFQDWDTISKELGTNRTGLQCCVKFQSQKASSVGKWSKEEDEKLKQLIDKFKIKDHIPWAKIAWHFENRSLRQCQERYDYHLGKIKKGIFTVEEDFVLVYLATKLKNFGEVAKYLPHRAATQVRSRYEYLVKMSMPKFTKEEDKLLTRLMIQYPRNWTKISEFFHNRSKLQCRGRWIELQKNINLDNDLVSDDEELQIQLGNNSNNVNSNLKSNEELNFTNFSHICNVKEKNKHSAEYKRLLEYHNHCHKFLFGPKPRVAGSSEETKKCSKYLRMIMNNLLINSSTPLDSFHFKSLSDNCEFDSEDISLLKEINENKELERGTQIINKVLPPNFITLVGLRSLLLTRSKIGILSNHYEPPEISVNDGIDPENRLLFTDAKKLFKARMKALFTHPLILSNLSQDGIEAKLTHKPKVRKGVRKMSKLRRKEHAKLMNQAFKRQKKLNEQLVSAGELQPPTNKNKTDVNTPSREKRKQGRKSKSDMLKTEEPEVKKSRRSTRISLLHDNESSKKKGKS